MPPSSNTEAAPLPLNYSRRGLDLSSDEAGVSTELARAYKDLCFACRSGDYDTVDTLISTPNLNINYVDDWDYSPLILASLCGHFKIVELLLLRGARCDRDTFEGARCIYGALNDEIRDLLLAFDVSKKVDILQPFASHISSLLNPNAKIQSKDITFTFPHIQGTLTRDYQVFKLNRFLLAARCSKYLKEKLLPGGEWYGVSEIKMPPSTDPLHFEAIVDYAYLRTDNIPIGSKELYEDLSSIAKLYQLDDLIDVIEKVNQVSEEKEKAKAKNEGSVRLIDGAREHMRDFLVTDIIGNVQVLGILDEEDDEIDFEEIDIGKYLTSDQNHVLLESSAIPDTIAAVIDVESNSIYYYPVHRSILGRSPYFETMFTAGMFLSEFPVIGLSSSISSKEIAEMILSFLYHDDIANIPTESSVDLLFAGEELFLERLKTVAAVRITSEFSRFNEKDLKSFQIGTGYNVFELIRISWDTRSDRLEQHLTKMIAMNLKHIYEDKTQRKLLADLIKDSAGRITERQETDTIELVDDIRYYLLKKYAVGNDFDELEHFLDGPEDAVKVDDINIYKKAIKDHDNDILLIDSLLQQVNLEA